MNSIESFAMFGPFEPFDTGPALSAMIDLIGKVRWRVVGSNLFPNFREYKSRLDIAGMLSIYRVVVAYI